MNGRLRFALAVGAAVIGIVAWPHAFAPIWGTWWERTLSVGIAWAFVASGLGAWLRRPEIRVGKILTLAGFLFFAYVLEGNRVPLIWTVASAAGQVWIPVVFYALLSYPEGRLRSRADRLVVGLNLLWMLGIASFAVFYDPLKAGCADCPANLNLILIRHDLVLVDNVQRYGALLLIATLILLVVVLVSRFVRATVPARRVLAPMSVPAAVFSLSYLAYLVFQQSARHSLYEAPENAYRGLTTALLVALLLMPMTFLVGLSRYRARRAKVSELVVELGAVHAPERLRDALSRTLGDPSVEVGFWLPAESRYLTTDGSRVYVPEGEGARSATYLEREGEPLAVIVHDTALLDDPGLVDAVAAAARFAVENDRLQAEVRAQLEEVRASRLRIVEAADEERQRIERNLHDGAQARLLSLSLALQVADSKLDEEADPELRRSLSAAGEELKSALNELRTLAQGIHPAVLTNEGLSAALEVLAERAPVRLELGQTPSERLSPNVEAAAYYVVSEAIANAAKYARANRVTVRAVREGSALVVDVADDGVGGASVDSGRGLRGLADRVQALGGMLEVKSPPGSGTRIVARIPCG